MSTPIVTPKIDVAKIVFESLSPTLPEDSSNFVATLDQFNDLLTDEEYDMIYSAAMLMVAFAQEAAFKLGWQLRGQA